ncbi:MAG: DUF3784 domain-containing protein [Clostridia bacterium]|nr:DUF3784 domain-containing protein [Clostridia bacterium]
MLALKIIAVITGLAFTLSGYFIFFRKKYNLINGFEEDFRAGRKTEEYAKRVGFTELVIGIVILAAAIILLIFA